MGLFYIIIKRILNKPIWVKVKKNHKLLRLINKSPMNNLVKILSTSWKKPFYKPQKMEEYIEINSMKL